MYSIQDINDIRNLSMNITIFHEHFYGKSLSNRQHNIGLDPSVS